MNCMMNKSHVGINMSRTEASFSKERNTPWGATVGVNQILSAEVSCCVLFWTGTSVRARSKRCKDGPSQGQERGPVKVGQRRPGEGSPVALFAFAGLCGGGRLPSSCSGHGQHARRCSVRVSANKDMDHDNNAKVLTDHHHNAKVFTDPYNNR